jgi:hypothetical protein
LIDLAEELNACVATLLEYRRPSTYALDEGVGEVAGVQQERDIWILLHAVSPKEADSDHQQAPRTRRSRVLRRLPEIDAAFDWSPDDPRLPALAQGPQRWLAAASVGASSPAWTRLAELATLEMLCRNAATPVLADGHQVGGELTAVSTRSNLCRGPHVTAYRATLDVRRELVTEPAMLLRAERRARGTRLLTCFRHALLVVV